MATQPAISRAEDTIRDALSLYRRRDMVLPGVGEAGWRMLLDLRLRHPRAIPVSSACLATGSPYTTGLRALANMQDSRLVSRSDHPSDRRSALVSLTEQGVSLVDTVLECR